MIYTIDTLKKENPEYTALFGVTQEDVDKVNYFIRKIENSRSKEKPLVGDIFQFTNEAGNYYPDSYLMSEKDGKLKMSKDASTPFVNQNISENICSQLKLTYILDEQINDIDIHFGRASYAGHALLGSEKYIGDIFAKFKTWGNHGAIGGGTLYFTAKVNLWEAKNPEPFYGDYSKKDWEYYHVNNTTYENFRKTGAIFYIFTPHLSYIYFKDVAELNDYINFVKGKMFINGYYSGMVLWCYLDKPVEVSTSEWNKLQLPIIQRDINGTRDVKIQYDDEKHIVTSYYLKIE